MSERAIPSPVASLVERLAAEGLDAHVWANGPGDRYGVHEHGFDKVLVAAVGSIRFELVGSDRSLELREGDRLDLPAGTPHGAQVGPEGVTCLEAHVARGVLGGVTAHHPGWATARSSKAVETVSDGMA